MHNKHVCIIHYLKNKKRVSMKKALLLAFVCMTIDGLSATDQASKGQQVGAWSRLKRTTYTLARMPFDATSWCVSKTKQTIVFVYKTADKMVYVVGLTTTGFLIYCYCNGKLEQVITVDAEHNQYWWHVIGVPLFNEIKIGLPKAFVDFCSISQEKIESLTRNIGVAARVLHEEAKRFKEQAFQAKEAAENAISGATRTALTETSKALEGASDAFEKAAQGLPQ